MMFFDYCFSINVFRAIEKHSSKSFHRKIFIDQQNLNLFFELLSKLQLYHERGLLFSTQHLVSGTDSRVITILFSGIDFRVITIF